MARSVADAHLLKQFHPFFRLNKFLNYGAERDRTADLQSAILALSQLSYCPIQTVKSDIGIFHNSSQITALTTERVGFEPTVHMVDTRSPGVPIQPLSHLSRKQGDEWHEYSFRPLLRPIAIHCCYQRRGWDSNPRYPEVQRFSRPSDSTTLAPLRSGCQSYKVPSLYKTRNL